MVMTSEPGLANVYGESLAAAALDVRTDPDGNGGILPALESVHDLEVDEGVNKGMDVVKHDILSSVMVVYEGKEEKATDKMERNKDDDDMTVSNMCKLDPKAPNNDCNAGDRLLESDNGEGSDEARKDMKENNSEGRISQNVRTDEASDEDVAIKAKRKPGRPRKDKNQPVREYKRRKRDDIGDLDFDVLMGSEDQGRAEEGADLGEVAAVSVGLKPNVPSPTEKVRFKDVMKRKSRVQEYLECRNFIVKLWTKDVRRLLLVTDCGVSAVRQPNESPRASLIRDIHEFLDYHGYINIGVVKRIKSDAGHEEQTRSLTQEVNLEQIPVAEQEVLFEVSDTDDKTSNGGKDSKEGITADFPRKFGSAEEEVVPMDIDATPSLAVSEKTSSIEDPKDDVHTQPPASESMRRQNDVMDSADVVSSFRKYDKGQGKRKHIIVVGAGPAGLAAARHMQRMNFNVTVLEARNRVGGRVFTDRSTFSVPVDLGASIITGAEADAERGADPSALICKQLGLDLTTIRGDCPLYDSVTGQKVPPDLDGALEEKLNALLDDTVALVAQNGDAALRMSLEEGLEQSLSKRKGTRSCKQGKLGNEAPSSLDCTDQNQVTVADFAEARLSELANGGGILREPLSESVRESSLPHQEDTADLERRIMDWHFANLEYGCAAQLDKVSLPYWNQDDIYGGFAGPHCMIKGGYGTLTEALAQGLNVELEKVVTEISYTSKDVHMKGGKKKQVRVRTEDGEVYKGDAALLTVPLGCLKAQTIKFVPQLPGWKSGSINRLGFGTLNKVVLEFDSAFWDENVEIFGATAESTESRGRCFMFWNLVKTVGAPVLIALVVGKAALDEQKNGDADLVAHAIHILRKLYGYTRVPEPKASKVTNWGSDQYSRGAYSYVAVGASGEDYDILGRPVEDCLFFAGEATCKEHPDTVGGAMMSGLKEAVRILDILENRGDLIEEAEAMASAQRQPDSERNEVRDMQIRISAAEYANNLRTEGSALDGEEEPFTKADLLKDMFRNAKTTAGRLFLAREMLQLSASSVKGFAGTKVGLSVLNGWILDSMGKDATQLLRHCIRLLLTVATDLLSIRQSGVGRTVKEKVCVHTSRDIRVLAGQLVKMWFEIYRREKSLSGPSKLKKGIPRTQDSMVASAPACSSSQRDHSQGNAEQASSRHEQKSGATSSDGPGDLESGENEIGMSEIEAAALAEAEACQAAAFAAAEAYATAEAERNSLRNLPKILSFHKFAKRETMTTKDVSIDWKRRNWFEQQKPSSGNGKPLPASVGYRKVANWSLDLTGSSNASTPSRMDAVQGFNGPILPEKEVLGESCKLQGVERFRDTELMDRVMPIAEPCNNIVLQRDESGNLQGRLDRTPSEVTRDEGRDRNTSEQIKKAVSEYVVHLLTPLYKTRKIQKDAFKAIVKKTTMKVMEREGVRDCDVNVSEYLNLKRKNKIRALVDQFVEKHLADTKQCGGSN